MFGTLSFVNLCKAEWNIQHVPHTHCSQNRGWVLRHRVILACHDLWGHLCDLRWVGWLLFLEQHLQFCCVCFNDSCEDFTSKRFIVLNYAHVCICHISTGAHIEVQRGSLVLWSCELPDAGAGNWIPVLWESSKCSLPQNLLSMSSPTTDTFFLPCKVTCGFFGLILWLNQQSLSNTVSSLSLCRYHFVWSPNEVTSTMFIFFGHAGTLLKLSGKQTAVSTSMLW